MNLRMEDLCSSISTEIFKNLDRWIHAAEPVDYKTALLEFPDRALRAVEAQMRNPKWDHKELKADFFGIFIEVAGIFFSAPMAFEVDPDLWMEFAKKTALLIPYAPHQPVIPELAFDRRRIFANSIWNRLRGFLELHPEQQAVEEISGKLAPFFGA
jgi:hypothetical protein